MKDSENAVDLRGLVCPEPVLRTKKLIDNPDFSSLEVLVDTEVNVKNLERLAHSKKVAFTSTDESGHFRISLSQGPESSSKSLPESGAGAGAKTVGSAVAKKSSSESESVGTVVFLGKDAFGEGDRDFSLSLVNVFLQTMFESGHRPRAVLMANSGVKLMGRDSGVRPVLDQFRDAGCDVLACGLCVEFYGLKEDVPTEQVTNMFSICEYMMTADKVINP